MAASADEKTEQPTPRRRKEAREKGQVARSQDLTAAVLLLAGFLSLALLGPGLWMCLVAMVQAALTGDAPASLPEVLRFAGAAVTETLKHIVPFLLILLVAMIAANIFMGVPIDSRRTKRATVIDLHEAHAAFDQTARQ